MRKSFLGGILTAAGILILAAAEWFSHRQVPFMMDDLWYSTNLATGEALRGLGDVAESQVWHFLNWGGRCVTHGLLQLTLMSGELAADLCNMAALLLLGWMVCVTAGCRRPYWFLAASSLLVALNANVKMSMFWQAGTVNYVYSTAWILLFLYPYLRQVEMPESGALPFVWLWMAPLGLMAGWSNENMGPACLLVSVAAEVYLVKYRHCRVRFWMLSGSAMCLAGSILVVAAPGNFVRSAAIEKKAFAAFLYDRFYSMLRAGAEYLFPSAALLAAVLLLWIVCMKGRLRPAQWMLLALAALSYGAMALSPHYPDRATFGTMAVCIALSLSVLRDILGRRRELAGYVSGAVFCYWCYALFALWRM